MSKGQAQQQSAFKQLFTEFFNLGGDFSKVSKDLKKPLKTYVKESYPHFLVTDGYFFVQPHFTKEAVAEFHQKFPNVNIVDLHDKVIVINTWSLELRRVNSAEVFTSYANLEARLVVHSFKPNLQERLNPTRYPVNLFRDDEFKTIIQHFRHQALQQSIAKNTKQESLPDISKLSGADAAGKKTKVDGGIVKTGASKGDEFADFSFKEGSTAVLKIQDIFVQEKGKDALKRIQDAQVDSVQAQPKVKGGAKGKKKAATKSATKKTVAAKKTAESADVRKSVDKIVKYTPNKPSSRKETPQKSQSAPAAGKSSAKRTTTGSKTKIPANPSPSGKKSTKTTDQMTMAQFKKYLDWHEKKKGGKTSSGGKVLGKRSAGKASATSGKASKASKRSKK
ncbi:UNKNOWN [Stylonychia lemnae]|uniref:Telomere-binding protein subunit beta n=1 Tax=Stylonychia lemnae TaxID=5949 RepID=A0A078AVL9_STYLE|nr:UNKNOWN [Stylonychia lemnae]|eukprot:CDW85312.1 UNKNOWN [Stylonychia lemnae]